MTIRICTLDIEVSPLLLNSWSLGPIHGRISPIMIERKASVMCIAAKWLDERRCMFRSILDEDGSQGLAQWAHDLIDEADAIVTFNGRANGGYDLPHLFREMAEHGISKPSPATSIDLLPICRKAFRMPSHKLGYITAALGLQHKIEAGVDFDLWRRCMRGCISDGTVDQKAWRLFERYCRNDVVITEQLYKQLLAGGWITGHPNWNLYTDRPVCSNCGAEGLQKGP